MLISAIPQHVATDNAQTNGQDKVLEDTGYWTLALRASEDDSTNRQKYRPFILSENTAEDWVDGLELNTALDIAEISLKNLQWAG